MGISVAAGWESQAGNLIAIYGQVPDSEAMVSRRLRDVDGKSRKMEGANGDIVCVMYVLRCTYVYIYIYRERYEKIDKID